MEGKKDNNLYFKNGKPRKNPKKIKQEPVSVVKEDIYTNGNRKGGFGGEQNGLGTIYQDPLLISSQDVHKKNGLKSLGYDPPLPVSIVKEPEPEPDKKYIPPKMRPSDNHQIFNADCLEKMKDLPNDSIDLIFCDLPYGQTSCKWDIKIDLDLFWKEVMRIKKLNTPIFFTTTTKFGVDLIKSAPKKCYFRYDIVWVKSAPAGFLSAKKMPMRKHEMIYVFYEKLPFYDLSSHQHKFLKHKENTDEESKTERKVKSINSNKGGLYSKISRLEDVKYNPPLPVSVVKEEKTQISKHKWVKTKKDSTYGELDIEDNKDFGGHQSRYNPPLPVSVVKEEKYDVNKGATMINGTLGGAYDSRWQKGHQGNSYEPPLPVSVVKEIKQNKYNHNPEQIYNAEYLEKKIDYEGRNGGSMYQPPLPNSMLEIKSTRGKHSTEKPVALMEWILKYYSKEGDTILDPTMGSGSTGAACKNMNRKFIGIEMDEDIFKVAKDRLN